MGLIEKLAKDRDALEYFDFITVMAEYPPEGSLGRPGERENFSAVKEWLFSKLQIPFSDTNDGQGEKEIVEDPNRMKSGKVPTIIISRGSNKSINSLMNTPVIRRQSPLAKTYSDIGTTKQHHHGLKTATNTEGETSIWSPSPFRRRGHRLAMSEPSTPFDGKNRSGLRSNGSRTRNFQLLSPAFRFSVGKNLSSASPSLSLRSTDSNVNVNTEQEFRRNLPENTKDMPKEVTEISDKITPRRTLSEDATNKKLTLRRTSSCGAAVSRSFARQNHQISKAVSQTDFHNSGTVGKKSHSGKFKRSRRNGSQKKARSAICLTRSISINLDPFKVRSSRKHSSDRKLSLANNDELERVYERRRSSLIRLLCNAKTDDSPEKSDETSSESSVKNISDFSPKVTRPLFIGSLRKLCNPFEDFRSTFESDSRDIPSIYGQVKIMFQYMTDKKQLEVTLLRGCNMAASTSGNLGIYAKICLLPGKRQRQQSENRHNTHDPTFHDLFCFRFTLDQVLESQLKLKFYDKPGIFSFSVPIGECYVELYNYDLTAVTVLWLNLKRSKGQTVSINLLRNLFPNNTRKFVTPIVKKT